MFMVDLPRLFNVTLVLRSFRRLRRYIKCIYISAENQRRGTRGSRRVARKDKKGGKKDSQLILRLNKEDRDAFVELCKDLDTSAAREIRHFIRKFLKENGKR